MAPLYNLLGTRPIQTGRERSMEPYPNQHFGFIDDPDRQSGSGSVPTRTRTRTDSPDPLLTLIMTWSVPRLCIPSCSCTSHCQICGQVNFRWVAVKTRPMFSENRGFSKGTQWIVVRFQIWQQEVKQQVEMHNLRTDHVMIRSELKYLIGAKVVNLKCQVFVGKTGPIATVWFLVW